MTVKTWDGTSADFNTAADWSPTGVPGTADIAVFGSTLAYVVDLGLSAPEFETVAGVVLDGAAATFSVDGDGTLALTPDAVFALQAGTLELGGTIAGGTLLAEGATLLSGGGEATLADVTLAGTLELSQSFVTIDALGLDFSAGSELDLTGSNSWLVTEGPQTFDNATLRFGTTLSNAVIDVLAGLTFGTGFVVDESGGGVIQGNSTVVNDGTIVGQPRIATIGFVNAGTIIVPATTLEFALFNEMAATFANNGLLALSGEMFVGGSFSSTGTIALQPGGILDLGIAFAASALGTVLNTGGTIEIDQGGTLLNSGLMLATGSGAFSRLGVLAGGTIAGGTVVDTAGGLLFGGGTLDDLTFTGTIDLSAALAAAELTRVTLVTVGGALTIIELTGEGAELTLLDRSDTLDNVLVHFGNVANDAKFRASGSVLLGASATIDVVAGADLIGATFVNDGTITIGTSVTELNLDPAAFVNNGTLLSGVTSGQFFFESGTASNAGTIGVSGGSGVSVANSFTNSGTITAGPGGDVDIAAGSRFANTGVIQVEQTGTLTIGGSYALAALGSLDLSGGTLEVVGTLDNRDVTLGLGTLGGFDILELAGGEIEGGTLMLPVGSLEAITGTLDGVTVVGTLSLGQNFQDLLVLTGGASVAPSGGAASIDLDGVGDELVYDQVATLSGTRIDFAFLGSLVNGQNALLTASTLTLASTTTVIADGIGNNAVLGDLSLLGTAESDSLIVNQGTILTALTFVPQIGVGEFDVTDASFSNTGLIEVAGGAALAIETAAAFSNSGTIALGAGFPGIITIGTAGLTAAFDNTGIFQLGSGAILDIGHDLTFTELGSIDNAGGTVEFDGTLNDNGVSLDLLPGGTFGAVALTGEIQGGTIAEDGGTLTFTRAGGVGADGATENAGHGTLDGLTVQGVLTVGGSQTATLLDTVSVLGSAGSAGTIVVAGGTLLVAGTLSGAATVTIAQGGSVDLGTGPGAGQSFVFHDASADVLGIANQDAFVGTLAGFVRGDTIDLSGLAFNASDTYALSDGRLLIESADHAVLATLTLTGSYAADGFALAQDGSGTDVTTTAPCYVRGTRIMTVTGEVAIEDLAIGEHVVTARGAARPIRWIGRRSYDGRLIAGNPAILPIRIGAGALADGVPRRDLQVSPDHAMFLDGVLIAAKLLVNGRTIVQANEMAELSYFHVELDTHDVIFAEGAAAETFVDCDSRMMFQNASGFYARHPEDPGRSWRFCAERVEAGEGLAQVRRRLAARAGLAADHVQDSAAPGALEGRVDAFDQARVSGWAFDAARPHTPVELVILVDDCVVGRLTANQFRADLRRAGKGTGRCAFRWPMPKPLSPDRSHLVTVRRAVDRALLTAAPLRVDADWPPGPLDGRIDGRNAVLVEGWARDADRPSVPVRLEVLDGGRVIGQTLANRYRADLAQAGLGACSFEFCFEEPLSSGVTVRRASDGAALDVPLQSVAWGRGDQESASF